MQKSIIAVNQAVIKRFAKLVEHNRLAHAYLFTGPELIGKSETALALAKAVNGGITFTQAENGLTVSEFEHIKTNDPDIHFIDTPFGEKIKIETVRDILAKSRLRPYFAPHKIFVIRNIDKLSLDAANAFLKTLEEPSADCLIFLTTATPEHVLSTIRSRCQAIYFAGEPYGRVADDLVKNYDVHSGEAQFLTYFTEGCLGKALSLNSQEFFEQKNEYIDEFVYQSDVDAFVKAITADKEQSKIFLDVLLTWVRDCLLAKCGVPESQMTHPDRRADIREFHARFSLDDMLDMYKDIVEAQRLLAGNFNLKVPLMIIKERING